MHNHYIPYKDTGFFAPIVTDYLAQRDKLKLLYKYAPDWGAFAKAIVDQERHKVNRELLVDVLREQYKDMMVSPETNSNIEKLLDTNTFTVTTGHQPCLFSGPLYVVYKIASAINLAAKLKEQYPDKYFVPVYWMGAEDHDFEEISTVALFGKELRWEQEQEQGGAVGRISTRTLKPVVENLKEILGDSHNAKVIAKLVEEAYLGEENLAQATRHFINKIYGKYGLVVLNSDDKRLKREFVSIATNDILYGQHEVYVRKGIDELEKAGYDKQAHPRKINCFYLVDGKRERIESDEKRENFTVLNTDISFTVDSLMEELREHPERFSPNVVLRPLLQQKLLPNLAYIGGGAEVNYWLQYRRIFVYEDVPFPMILLRNSVMIVDRATSEKMEKLGLEVTDLFTNTDTLVKEYVAKHSDEELELTGEKEDLEKVFSAVKERALAIDPTLEKPVEGEKQKQLNALENLEGKMRRAQKQRFETSVKQIEGIKEKLFPGGKLQERVENFMPFYLKYGEPFFAYLVENLDPLSTDFLIVEDKPLSNSPQRGED